MSDNCQSMDDDWPEIGDWVAEALASRSHQPEEDVFGLAIPKPPVDSETNVVTGDGGHDSSQDGSVVRIDPLTPEKREWTEEMEQAWREEMEREFRRDAFLGTLDSLAITYENDPDAAFAALMEMGGMSPIEALKSMRSHRCGNFELDWSRVDRLQVMECMMEQSEYRYASRARLALRNAFGNEYVRGICCKGRRYWIGDKHKFTFEFE